MNKPKKKPNNWDRTLVGRYIRQIENPDSVGWNPVLKIWEAPKSPKYDKRNRGMGVDVLNNEDAIAITEGRPGKYMTEEEERYARNKHIDYSLGVIGRQKDYITGIDYMSPRKEAETVGLIYRGDAGQLKDASTPLGKAYRSGDEEEFHKAVGDYYRSKGLHERARQNDAFWAEQEKTSENIQQLPHQESYFERLKGSIAGSMKEAVKAGSKTGSWAYGGNISTPKTWGNLSMKEKADIMKVAVQNGITNLQDIRDRYNEFAESGDLTNDDYFSIGDENEYSSGGKIHIKPSHRGRFTELKKRTGHSASWFKAHGTPAQRKMAIFALNSKKWKHADGGPLVDAANAHIYDGTTEDSQQMNTGNWEDWTYTAAPLKEEPIVTAPRKYFVRYDENGNPIYTKDYTLSQEAITNSLPEDPEAARRKQALVDIKNRPAGQMSEWMKPIETAVVGGVGGAMLTPFVIAPMLADAWVNAPATIGGFVGGEVGGTVDKKFGITNKVNEWTGLKLPEGTVGNLVGGIGGGWLGSEATKLPQFIRLNKTYGGVPHKQVIKNNMPVVDDTGNPVYMDETFLKNKNNFTIWTSDSPEYASNGTWAKHSGNSVFDVYTDPKELHLLKTPDVGKGKMVNWQLLPYNKNKGSIQMAEHITTKPVIGIQKDRITSLTKRMPDGSYNPSDAGEYVFKDGEEYVINAKDYGAGLSTDDVVQYSKDMGYDGAVFNRVYDGGVEVNGDYYDFPINELVLNPGAPSYAVPHGTSKLKIWNQLPAKRSYMTSWILPTIENLNYE